MHGWKVHALVKPPTLGPEPTVMGEQTAPTTKENINDTHLGTMRPGGAVSISERKLDGMMSEQRHKHPQGSLQRGNAPAPTLPSTAEGTVPVATAVGTETQQP